MMAHEKECQDCGWRGTAAELEETMDDSTGKTHIFCPDCGGTRIEDLNSEKTDETTESRIKKITPGIF